MTSRMAVSKPVDMPDCRPAQAAWQPAGDEQKAHLVEEEARLAQGLGDMWPRIRIMRWSSGRPLAANLRQSVVPAAPVGLR